MMICDQSSLCSVDQQLDPNRSWCSSNTINGKVRNHRKSQPEKEAIVFYDDDDERSTLTNEELMDLAERCASLMHSHGVRKGEVVCNMLPNSLEREVVNFAILFAGAVVLHGDGIIDSSKYFWEPLNLANVQHIVVDPSPNSPQWKMLDPIMGGSEADIEIVTNCSEMPNLKKIFKFRLQYDLKRTDPDLKATFDLIRAHHGVFVERVSSLEPAAIYVDYCNIQMRYRMVMRTHEEVCQMAHRVEDMLQFTFHDIVYCDIPISWIHGLPLAYIANGCTMVKSTLCYCPLTKIVPQTWNLIEMERCTMAALQPPMVQMLTSHRDDVPEPKWKLRAIATAGQVRQAVRDAIGSCTETIIICYSMIEAGLVARLVINDDNKDRYSEGCVGDLSNPIRTKFEPSKASQIGEVLLKGKLVCREYYRDPYLTRVSFTEDGFLLTGDLGFTSESTPTVPGQLFVLGRKSDAIIRDNTAIYPREIEEKVNQCPGIWKVKVVSIKDDKGIVQMCACVIPRSQDALTIDRVKEFCRYQLGGTFDDDNNPHMPTYVFFFEQFPMKQGKVNRRLLAFMASEIVHNKY